MSVTLTTTYEVVAELLHLDELAGDDLERHIEWGRVDEREGFINFSHPLVHGSMLLDEEMREAAQGNDDIDKLLQHLDPRWLLPRKHKALRQHSLGKGVYIIERPYRPYYAHVAIRKGLHRHDDEALAAFIRDVWEDTESAASVVWRDVLDAYPLHVDPDPAGLLDDSGTTTVYRGVRVEGDLPAETVGNFAWTTSRTKAEWFAKRFAALGGSPVVLTGEVDSDRVLFTTNERGESEVVCLDTVDITSIELA